MLYRFSFSIKICWNCFYCVYNFFTYNQWIVNNTSYIFFIFTIARGFPLSKLQDRTAADDDFVICWNACMDVYCFLQLSMTLLYVEAHVWKGACVAKSSSTASCSWWWICSEDSKYNVFGTHYVLLDFCTTSTLINIPLIIRVTFWTIKLAFTFACFVSMSDLFITVIMLKMLRFRSSVLFGTHTLLDKSLWMLQFPTHLSKSTCKWIVILLMTIFIRMWINKKRLSHAFLIV